MSDWLRTKALQSIPVSFDYAAGKYLLVDEVAERLIREGYRVFIHYWPESNLVAVPLIAQRAGLGWNQEGIVFRVSDPDSYAAMQGFPKRVAINLRDTSIDRLEHYAYVDKVLCLHPSLVSALKAESIPAELFSYEAVLNTIVELMPGSVEEAEAGAEDVEEHEIDGRKKPLVWEGWIGQEISFGVIIDETMQHLQRRGWDTQVLPVGLVGSVATIPPATRRAVRREETNRERLRGCDNLIAVRHSHTCDWLQLQYTNAAVKVGYAPDERTALEPADRERANKMDVVMVTSSYVEQVFKASGVRRPSYVYHHGYDPAVLKPRERPERSTFTFLAVSVLNLRKGPDLLLSAFVREFSRDPDVRLVVKTSPHVWHRELHGQLLARYGGHPQVTFLQHHHTDEQMAGLYYEADCFVLPTRAEGFGMPILEAMATGLPVIVTDWSGHLDFCTHDNSYLIEVKNRRQLEFVMGVESWWAAPDEEHLAALMRQAVEDREGAREKGRRAARDVESWTWERQVNKLSQFLETL